MALQKQMTLDSGIVLDESYHRVMDIRLSRNLKDGTAEEVAAVNVFMYKDSTARFDGNGTVGHFQFDMTGSDYDTWLGVTVLDGTNVNPFSKVYGYMKDQTNLGGIDYTDATNV